MKLHFLGAAETVTGSKFLIESGNIQVLIDCGLFQGMKSLRSLNWQPLPINLNKLNAVILTHAHIDHTGYLPLLIKNGFEAPVYSTPATKDLCDILLPDSGYLQEEDAKYANKKGFSKHKPALPLYTKEDAISCLGSFKTIPFNQDFLIQDRLRIRFSDAGHILGAACVHISDGKNKIVFSGDLGGMNDSIMKSPETIESADYLVVESTYGNRIHDNTDPKQELSEIINRTIDRKGILLIPSFAIGRAQTILHLIAELRKEKEIGEIPVYLNSPMAINATDIFCKYQNEHLLTQDQCHDMCNIAEYVRTSEQSKSLTLKKEPMIIISASGMATGGRILHHLKALVSDPKNTILFIGYQAAGTRGQAMISGVDKIKIHGNYYPVRADVVSINGLSAHADYKDISDWISRMKNHPKKIFLVHGEPSAQEYLKSYLGQQIKSEVIIPQYMQCFDIN